MPSPLSPFLHQVTGQKEVGDAFPDGVLVAAAAAHQLALHDLRLHEQAVQVLERLLVRLELLDRGRVLWQGGEAQLFVVGCFSKTF